MCNDTPLQIDGELIMLTGQKTYSKVSNVAHGKGQCNFYNRVIKNEPEPQHRYYPKSKPNSYAGQKKRSHHDKKLHRRKDNIKPNLFLRISRIGTYAPSETLIKNLIISSQLKLSPMTIL